MNDFFTELDADLLGAEKATKLHISPVPVVKPHTLPPVGHIPKTSVPAPVYQKQETRVVPLKQNMSEKKDTRVRRDPPEEPVSNFSVSETRPSIFPITKPQFLPVLSRGSTRVVPIGGCNETGKNMTMYQYGDEIVLIDGGIQSPESDMLGAKYALPDITPLFPLKKKIIAIVITNGHSDHITGLKNLLPALGYPKVYGTKLTIGIIKREMEDAQMLQKVELHTIDIDTIFPASAHIKIELFSQSCTIPGAVGVYIETPNAKVVHTGDFQLRQDSSREKLRLIGARGIDLLLSDSNNSLKDRPLKTEAEFGAELHEIISKTEGRIIIATSDTLLWRIGQIIESAEKTGRTVFVNGRNIIENVNLARELGYIRYSQNLLQRITSKIDSLPDNSQIILTTGSQGESDSGLYRMAYGEHPIVKIRPGDVVILSSTPISGNEQEMTRLMNTLIRLGATLFTKEGLHNHMSEHASRDEQRAMLELVKPRNFMPIQGELFMRIAHKQTALASGIPGANIFLSDNGNILDIDEKGVITKNTFKLQMEEIIVDGHGIGIATSHVIEARAQMMKSGVVTIVFKADEKTKTLLGHLKIETRGLVYLDEVREAHKMIIKKARASYEDTVKDIPDIEEKDLIKIIRRDMELFLLQKMERSPVIIPMVLYI